MRPRCSVQATSDLDRPYTASFRISTTGVAWNMTPAVASAEVRPCFCRRICVTITIRSCMGDRGHSFGSPTALEMRDRGRLRVQSRSGAERLQCRSARSNKETSAIGNNTYSGRDLKMRDAGEDGVRHVPRLNYGLQRGALRYFFQRGAVASGNEVGGYGTG